MKYFHVIRLHFYKSHPCYHSFFLDSVLWSNQYTSIHVSGKNLAVCNMSLCVFMNHNETEMSTFRGCSFHAASNPALSPLCTTALFLISHVYFRSNWCHFFFFPEDWYVLRVGPISTAPPARREVSQKPISTEHCRKRSIWSEAFSGCVLEHRTRRHVLFPGRLTK